MRRIDEEEGLDCEYLSKELISLYRYTISSTLISHVYIEYDFEFMISSLFLKIIHA